MNTLQYFLSTLRPAPPPSPRASTSELPISASVAPGERQDASDVPVEVQMDETEAEERRQGVIQDDGEFAAEVERRQDEEGQARLPPHIGVIPPSRRPSWKGKARVAGDAAVLATEDPLRDGATVQTELERGEGVESSFVDEKVPVDQAYNGTVALRDPEKALPSLDTSTVSGKPHAASSSPAWPWMTRLARWWPFRLTTSIYVLVRRFLSLFGLPYSPRSGYNALLAPAFSTEHGASADDEKGKGGRTRFVTLALTLSQRSLPQTESRMLSPSPSPTPSPGIPRAPQPPPRLTPKTLVLDLDETLIHSTSRQSSSLVRRAPKGLKMRVVEVVLDGRSTVYTVYKRPWVDFFLRKVSSWYTVVIFTASLPEYAEPVIDWLDGGDGRGGMVAARLFRADCMPRNGSYVKDLTVVEPDLSRVCLVDNSPASYSVNQANGIPIEGWINDPNDECLLDLLPMLDSLRFTNDVRRVLGLRGFGKRESGGGGVGMVAGGASRGRMR